MRCQTPGISILSGLSLFLLLAALPVQADMLWDLNGSILTATTTAKKLVLPNAITLLQPLSTSTASGLQVDTSGLPAGSNGILVNAPAGWNGNLLYGSLNGIQEFRIKYNGQAFFTKGVDIQSGCFSVSGTCIGTGGVSKTRLTNSTTFYISTTGSDSADGKTPATAWATLQHGWDTVKNEYDIWGQQVVFQLADGTYTSGLQAAGNLTGDYSAQQVTIRGNVANPGAVVIQPTGTNPSFSATWGAMYAIEGLKMDHHNTTSDMVMVGQYATIAIGHVEFGYNFNPWNDITAAFLAHVMIYADYTISGGGQTHMDIANDSSLVFPTNCNAGLFTVTILNNPNFPAGFIYVASNAQAHVQAITWNGTVQGPRFVVEGNGIIDTCTNDLNYLPGNAPGIIRSGGQYLPVTNGSATAGFGSAGQVAFYNTSGTTVSGSSVLNVAPIGALGINTVPSANTQLDVRNNFADTVTFQMAGPTHTLQWNETGDGGGIKTVTNGIFTFGTNNITRMTIDASGNVGVATTSPAARLDVAGAVRVGTSAAPKGITLYDTVGGSPYCLKITNGAVTASSGTCAN